MCQCVVGPYRDSGKLRRTRGCCGYEGILSYQYVCAIANLEFRISFADTHQHMKA
jgi:hypothetical protein